MIQRVCRPVAVAIDGRLVPVPGNGLRLEGATGESDLYRRLAVLGRSPAAVARAASRWGLLARTTPLLPVYVPALAEAFATYRDELARDAAALTAGAPAPAQTRLLIGATGRAFERTLELVVRKIAARIGLTAEELAEMQQRAERLDLSEVHSATDFVRVAGREAEGFRATHASPGEPQPVWAREWDEAGNIWGGVDRLGEDLNQVATAGTRAGRLLALRRLLARRPPSLRSEIEAGPEDLSEAVAPLLGLVDNQPSESPVVNPPDVTADLTAETSMASALLVYWQLGDSLALDGPAIASIPRLGDADTWRTVATLGHACQPSSRQTATLPARLVAPEDINDWFALAVECALWRDAVDAMTRTQWGFVPLTDRDTLHVALRTLELRLVSMGVVAGADRPRLESEPAEEARERLLRWITARCAAAGVEPRPQSGIVGTEGRALWSIRDALTARPPIRGCQWSECREPLPAGSYAHRKYCDRHRRETNNRRMVERRARRAGTAQSR
jgi:hypothetical protein